MAQDHITPDRTFSTPYAAEERVTVFLRSVYGWMCAGLGITALVAYFVAQSPRSSPPSPATGCSTGD